MEIRIKKAFVVVGATLLWCGCRPSADRHPPKISAPMPAPVSTFTTNPQHTLAEHLEAVRTTMLRPNSPAGYLPLPRPYYTSCGTADGLPYFESYFTMLGLPRSAVEDMVHNFAYLIDQYGHVPSIHHPDYLSRSHPPMFSLMVKYLDQLRGDHSALVQYYPQLTKEYAFWMEGSKNLKEEFSAEKRVVRVQMGQFMNRYFDSTAEPRPEHAADDRRAAADETNRPAADTYQQLRAATESAWGLCSRWGVTPNHAGAVETADLLPIDLNSLMWHLEWTLAEAATRAGDAALAQHYGHRAQNRRRLLRDLFFNPHTQWYEDFNWKTRNLSGRQTLAGMFPLWMELVEKNQAAAVAKTMEARFLRHGGVPASLERTGFPLDLPYGTAPLTWATVQGLKNYQFETLARVVQSRWMEHCSTVFEKTGKIADRYDVENPQAPVSGAYPFQDGYGPTNGVLWKMLHEGEK